MAGAAGPADHERPVEAPGDQGTAKGPCETLCGPPSYEDITAGGEETGESAGARREETLSGTVKRKSPPAPGPVETRAAPARYEDLTPGAVPTGYEDITAGAASPADPPRTMH